MRHLWASNEAFPTGPVGPSSRRGPKQRNKRHPWQSLIDRSRFRDKSPEIARCWNRSTPGKPGTGHPPGCCSGADCAVCPNSHGRTRWVRAKIQELSIATDTVRNRIFGSGFPQLPGLSGENVKGDENWQSTHYERSKYRLINQKRFTRKYLTPTYWILRNENTCL